MYGHILESMIGNNPFPPDEEEKAIMWAHVVTKGYMKVTTIHCLENDLVNYNT
ncbi:MAG: hypothetical protein JSW00_00085 [Thermoplasmata archaeon]|nr:MAG: hypothetical protein JSW00_00085 [Thermoplasmata archaeon]